jgi:hypothetical protein
MESAVTTLIRSLGLLALLLSAGARAVEAPRWIRRNPRCSAPGLCASPKSN